jgi:hypothetical protein
MILMAALLLDPVMRKPMALVALLLAAALAGCGNPAAREPSAFTGPNGVVLLANPNSGAENFEMEAGFDGRLALSAGCVIGRLDDKEVALIFPAGTRFAGEDPLTVQVEGNDIEVGTQMNVSLGGGFLSGGQLESILEDAPVQCQREETLYVQTVSPRHP